MSLDFILFDKFSKEELEFKIFEFKNHLCNINHVYFNGNDENYINSLIDSSLDNLKYYNNVGVESDIELIKMKLDLGCIPKKNCRYRELKDYFDNLFKF